MANPQAENGHVDIANKIVEALAKTHLSSYESQILWAIFRKTYGWHKKEDWITGTQLSEMTDIVKSHISRTLKKLVKRSIITKNGKKLSFQKDYDKWEKLPKQVTNKKLPIQDKKLPKQVTKVTQIGQEVTQIGNHKRNYTKETIIKETITKEKGDDFIKAWKDFKTMRKKIRKPMTERAEELIIKKLNKLAFSELLQIAILNQSIMNSWQGIFPLKEDSGEYNDKVMEILDYLNKKTGKEYTIDIPDKIYIITRLKEGRPIETFKKIIDIKCDKWMGKVNKEGGSMEDYLTPKTLFGINFENYLNEPKIDKYSKYLKKEE